MDVTKSKRPTYELPRALATCVFALSATSVYSDRTLAQEQAQPSLVTQASVLSPAHLERAFWLCDYVATTRGIHATPVATCSAITDELKNVRFGGDFLEFNKWWKLHNPAEHSKLAASAPQ